ncbi:CPBP family intramembrane glutamic endopeptidase [Pontibacter chitinilyticus]|uniref:CPBP family intramembrane glutamic endopeptidase n=1 Tax=Pontibacter chitinilyticus TaxID=2674989 RepID=UPI0032190FCC
MQRFPLGLIFEAALGATLTGAPSEGSPYFPRKRKRQRLKTCSFKMTVDKPGLRGKRAATLAQVLLFYMLSLLVLMSTSRLAKGLPAEAADLLSVSLASVLTFLLVYLFARWGRLRLADVGVVPGKATLQRFITGYAVGLLMAATQVLTVYGFGHLRLTLVPNMAALPIALAFLLYFSVACREELVFRSYSLRSLASSFSSSAALVLITVVFVLEHAAAGMTWRMAVVGSGLGGVLFGLAALKTRGLALPLGLHSAWNFGQWAAGFKNGPGIWNAVVEKGHERETENLGLAAFVLVMLLAITGIASFYRRKSAEETEPPHTSSP